MFVSKTSAVVSTDRKTSFYSTDLSRGHKGNTQRLLAEGHRVGRLTAAVTSHSWSFKSIPFVHSPPSFSLVSISRMKNRREFYVLLKSEMHVNYLNYSIFPPFISHRALLFSCRSLCLRLGMLQFHCKCVWVCLLLFSCSLSLSLSIWKQKTTSLSCTQWIPVCSVALLRQDTELMSSLVPVCDRFKGIFHKSLARLSGIIFN